MLITVTESSPEPLYRQIAAQVRGALASGELAAGDRLPPVRELAAALSVNMHTVRRAYAELRDEQLVEMRRGRAVSVLAGTTRRAQVAQMARGLVHEARRHGLTDADIRTALEEQL